LSTTIATSRDRTNFFKINFIGTHWLLWSGLIILLHSLLGLVSISGESILYWRTPFFLFLLYRVDRVVWALAEVITKKNCKFFIQFFELISKNRIRWAYNIIILVYPCPLRLISQKQCTRDLTYSWIFNNITQFKHRLLFFLKILLMLL